MAVLAVAIDAPAVRRLRRRCAGRWLRCGICGVVGYRGGSGADDRRRGLLWAQPMFFFNVVFHCILDFNDFTILLSLFTGLFLAFNESVIPLHN